MKKYILFLLLVASNLSLLDANNSFEIKTLATCSDSKNLSDGSFSITIYSNILNLSKDAVQDNTGGYVNIPEEKYYLKSGNQIYRIRGGVERSREKGLNQFSSIVSNNSKRLINIQELYHLKNSKDLQLIQKINLEYKSNNTSNILNVHFDEESFNKEYQRCKEQIHTSNNTFYLQSLFILLLISVLLYFLRKYFRQ